MQLPLGGGGEFLAEGEADQGWEEALGVGVVAVRQDAFRAESAVQGREGVRGVAQVICIGGLGSPVLLQEGRDLLRRRLPLVLRCLWSCRCGSHVAEVVEDGVVGGAGEGLGEVGALVEGDAVDLGEGEGGAGGGAPAGTRPAAPGGGRGSTWRSMDSSQQTK